MTADNSAICEIAGGPRSASARGAWARQRETSSDERSL